MEDARDQLVHDAVAVILSDEEQYDTSLNWAVNYCRQATIMKGHALKMQVPYILGNITTWRHPRAKEVRDILKGYLKGVK